MASESKTVDEDLDLAVNSIVGQYKVTDQLGSGTFGIVWRAVGETGPVAIKEIPFEIPPDSGTTVAEVSAQKYLDHPNVQPILDVLYREKRMLIIMPLMIGNLRKAFAADPQSKLVVAAQILCGLMYIHANGFLHLDLKPENVLMAADGTPRISDFGSVQYALDPRYANPNFYITSWYRPPEMFCGYQMYDKKADIWSYGILLIEYLFNVNYRKLWPAGVGAVRWIHDNIGWPRSFTDLLTAHFAQDDTKSCKDPTTLELDRDAKDAKSCKDLAPVEQKTAAELEEAFIPDPHTRTMYQNIYKDKYKKIWALIRNTLTVDPALRSLDGAADLFSDVKCRALEVPVVLKEPSPLSYSVFERLTDRKASDATVRLSAILWDALQAKLKAAETKESDKVKKAKAIVAGVSPPNLQIMVVGLTGKHLCENRALMKTIVDELEKKRKDAAFKDWKDVTRHNTVDLYPVIEPSLMQLLGDSLWSAMLVPAPLLTSTTTSTATSATTRTRYKAPRVRTIESLRRSRRLAGLSPS